MNEITIYQFDQKTGEYIGRYTEVEDPRLHKDWSDRTLVAPPKTHQEGFVYVLKNNQWIQTADYRGQNQYSTADKTASIVDYLGDIKAGFTLDKPDELAAWDAKIKKWVIDGDKQFDQVRSAKRGEINAKRTETELSGFEFSGVIFDSDRDSIARISNAVIGAQIATASKQLFTVNWTVKDNSVIELDANAMFGVQIALVTHVNATHEKARELKEAIDAAKTIADIEAIAW